MLMLRAIKNSQETFMKVKQFMIKILTFPPFNLISSKHSIANKWSIPGSSPTSFTTIIPASSALQEKNSHCLNNVWIKTFIAVSL